MVLVCAIEKLKELSWFQHLCSLSALNESMIIWFYTNLCFLYQNLDLIYCLATVHLSNVAEIRMVSALS